MGHTVLDLLFTPPFFCNYPIDNMSSSIRKSNLYLLKHPFVIFKQFLITQTENFNNLIPLNKYRVPNSIPPSLLN
jgi:hypothetical protein